MDASLISKVSNSFGLELLKVLLKESKCKNSFISPFSISVALSMVKLGAKAKTNADMAKAMQWGTADDDEIHKQFSAFLQLLRKASDQYDLTTANRIYLEKDFPILEDFKSKAKALYLTEPVSANFRENNEQERHFINAWVAEQTQNMIKDLLSEGVLSADTRMVLVNAIYFKGKWDSPFSENDTQNLPFKIAPGTTKQVPMMCITNFFPFYEDEELNCTVVELPYKGKDLGMVVILPKDEFGLEELIQNLTSETLNVLLNNVAMNVENLQLTLPKFEITSSLALKDTLSNMGMDDVFSTAANFNGMCYDKKGLRLSDVVTKAVIQVTSSFELKPALSALGMAEAFDEVRADFTGITGDRDLVLSAVVHKAFVQVNEEGTKAAAATAAVMMFRCAMPRPKPIVKVDHPFLFAIRDRRTKHTILFLGQVADPSE